jgi:hypothetical protein
MTVDTGIPSVSATFRQLIPSFPQSDGFIPPENAPGASLGPFPRYQFRTDYHRSPLSMSTESPSRRTDQCHIRVGSAVLSTARRVSSSFSVRGAEGL